MGRVCAGIVGIRWRGGGDIVPPVVEAEDAELGDRVRAGMRQRMPGPFSRAPIRCVHAPSTMPEPRSRPRAR